MDIMECLEILSYHNKWRRGYRDECLPPVVVGEAIDFAINELSRGGVLVDVGDNKDNKDMDLINPDKL